MGKLIKLARLQFLVAGLALFLFGAGVAILLGAPSSPGRLLLGSLIVLTAQLAVNFGNDYFDVISDQPDGGTFISGGSGILLKHPELRPTIKWIVTSLIVCSLGMGVLFQQMYDLPYWVLGFVILGNFLGWMYSAPPFRLSHRGLGEISFTFVTGFLVPALGYVAMRGTLDSAGRLFLIPLVCYVLVFILSVEIPDVEDDRLADKRTWVARFGRKFGFIAIGCLVSVVTGYFLFLSRILSPQLPINFIVVTGLSLLPLLPGLWGWARKPVLRGPATQIATSIVIALALFLIFIDGYLLLLIQRLSASS